MGRMTAKLGILANIFILATGCGLWMPPLRVTPGENEVMVDVMTLGEYPTAIRKIRLMDADSSETIWELRADATVPKIWKFSLRKGENPGYANNATILEDLKDKKYRVIIPEEAQTFRLEANKEYVIQVCGEGSWRCPKRIFTIPE